MMRHDKQWIEFVCIWQMILIAVFLAVAAAAPQDEVPIIKILKQTQNHDTETQEYSFRSVPLFFSDIVKKIKVIFWWANFGFY